jgi:hypothetical protein
MVDIILRARAAVHVTVGVLVAWAGSLALAGASTGVFTDFVVAVAIWAALLLAGATVALHGVVLVVRAALAEAA